MAATASQLYGTNLVHLLSDLGNAQAFQLNTDDEIVNAALVLKSGELRWPRPARPPQTAAAAAPKPTTVGATRPKPQANGKALPVAVLALTGVLFLLVGLFAPVAFLGHFTVLVLSCFVGWQVVWNVTPALHTPLMSVTNAISGIILIGGMLKISGQPSFVVTALAAAAVLVATVNVSGGFLVTQRMLRMFQK
jgi:NAD(P) transhydrogenase subunit alpha